MTNVAVKVPINAGTRTSLRRATMIHICRKTQDVVNEAMDQALITDGKQIAEGRPVPGML